MFLADLISMIVLSGYIFGSVLHLTYILKRHDNLPRVANLIIGISFLLHSIVIVFKFINYGQIPAMTPGDSMAFFAWAIIGTLLFINWRFRIYILGALITPIAASFMFVAAFIIPARAITYSSIMESAWLTIHITSAFTGNGFFAAAFCAGIMYLIQESYIKKKQTGFLSKRLPSLSTLDKINNISLKAGFPFLTIGLITGFIYAKMVWHSYFRWDPKEILSIISWIIYTILLHERITVGWQGRRPAIMAIAGFILVLFTFLGVNYLFTGHHKF